MKKTSVLSPEKQNQASLTTKIKGCDFSHWNGQINWAELKGTDIGFAFIKATQGGDYIDPSFQYNWNSAKENSIVRGAYHFYQPGIDPIQQADHFLNTVDLQKGDLLPVLDIETSNKESSADLTRNISIWLSEVERHIGRPAIIYTDRGFWNNMISKPFSNFPLWIADWQDIDSPELPIGWDTYAFWQYSSSGTIQGVPSKGKVDLNYFNGATQDLKHFQIQ